MRVKLSKRECALVWTAVLLALWLAFFRLYLEPAQAQRIKLQETIRVQKQEDRTLYYGSAALSDMDRMMQEMAAFAGIELLSFSAQETEPVETGEIVCARAEAEGFSQDLSAWEKFAEQIQSRGPGLRLENADIRKEEGPDGGYKGRLTAIFYYEKN